MLQSPLIHNGYALIASAGVTSVLGLFFWILAARLYTPEQVGLGAALISTMLTLGHLSQLNLANIVNRFLPVAGSKSRRLISMVYGIGTGTALVSSMCAIFLLADLLPDLQPVFSAPGLIVCFVAATVAWTLFALQDSVLAALRKAAIVPVENAFYAVAKITLLLIVPATAVYGPAVFAAWILPLPIIVVVINILIFCNLAPSSTATVPSQQLHAGDLVRFFGWDYAGTVAMTAAMGLSPLLVMKFVGQAAIAEYHIAWTIAYALHMIGRSMGVSLLTEASLHRGRLPALVADALVHTLLPSIVAVAVVIAAAPWIMGLFGAAYADEGTVLLRLLVVACLPWGITNIYLAAARSQGRMSDVAFVQIVTLAVLVATSIPLLNGLGVAGMGWAWLAAHCTAAISVIALAAFRGGAGFFVDGVLRLASSVARIRIGSLSAQHAPLRWDQADQSVLDELAVASGFGSGGLRPERMGFGLSDVRTIVLTPAEHEGRRGRDAASATEVYLKTSLTSAGLTSLERSLAEVGRLRSDARLKDVGFRLPEVLATARRNGALWVLEKGLPGEDGRTAIQDQPRRAPAIASAIASMAALHRRTSGIHRIDGDWIRRWIQVPCKALEEPVSALMTREQRRRAIHAFQDEQCRFWENLDVPLGYCHGDCSPGNLLFSAADVSAVLDWDQAAHDAPPGIDACHLVLTSSALLDQDELGHVVRRVLMPSTWSPEEKRWLAAAADTLKGAPDWTRDPIATRAVVGLTWLQHITANMDKAHRYAQNHLWVACNIDRVLQVFTRKPS